ACGRLKAKRTELEQALVGTLKPHHRFLLTEHLVLIETLEEAIRRVRKADRGPHGATRPAVSSRAPSSGSSEGGGRRASRTAPLALEPGRAARRCDSWDSSARGARDPGGTGHRHEAFPKRPASLLLGWDLSWQPVIVLGSA